MPRRQPPPPGSGVACCPARLGRGVPFTAAQPSLLVNHLLGVPARRPQRHFGLSAICAAARLGTCGRGSRSLVLNGEMCSRACALPGTNHGSGAACRRLIRLAGWAGCAVTEAFPATSLLFLARQAEHHEVPARRRPGCASTRQKAACAGLVACNTAAAALSLALLSCRWCRSGWACGSHRLPTHLRSEMISVSAGLSSGACAQHLQPTASGALCNLLSRSLLVKR